MDMDNSTNKVIIFLLASVLVIVFAFLIIRGTSPTQAQNFTQPHVATWAMLYNTSIPIMNQAKTVGINSSTIEGLPDAFANHIVLKSNQTLSVEVLDYQQLLYWYNNYWEAGANNYTYRAVGKNINFWFNQTEGCGAYVLLISSADNQSFSFQPNITSIYHPADYVTGECASS